MKAKLISYTADARELLIFSKRTRLKMSAGSFAEVKNMSEEEKGRELNYVFGTIGSSWEFVDYVFMIEDVTRAFTHQLVRHRVGVAFAQQAMRVVDATDFEYLATGSAKENVHYHDGMSAIRLAYKDLMWEGVNPQDARGILPTNILTNILMKINLRSLSGLLNVRLCYKAQGEFQDVARVLREEVLAVHPWAEPILQVHCVQHGSCTFTNYKDCPIKIQGALPEVDKIAIKKIWDENRMEVQPK